MGKDKKDDRSLKASKAVCVPAPDLPYQPPVPKTYRPRIGLVGCGGIAHTHLEAYRKYGYEVVALCDPNQVAAEELRATYYPRAVVHADPSALFARADIDVVDIATHPEVRIPLVRAALENGKHVLSQKPFATDLAEGRRLVELAERKGLKLAVNQNGRWAPCFSYLRQAVKAGLLGEVVSMDVHIAWDHSWIKGTAFENNRHVVLYDFGIHWFDMVACVFGDRPVHDVHACVGRVHGQTLAPSMSAHATIRYDGGMASLAFHGNTRFDPAESTVVTGTKGVFRSSGAVCGNDAVTLATDAGRSTVGLAGQWFPDGFAGAMGELLCAIEEDREPENNARANLQSLELCFAALASADSGNPVVVGSIQAAPDLCIEKATAINPGDRYETE